MRNHEVTQRHQLLDLNGRLMEPGWSKDLVQVYDRRAIKAPKFRIKEWDYYLVLSDQFACAFTLSDDGYIGLQSVSLLDFTKPWEHTETILNAFPMGKMKMLLLQQKEMWYTGISGWRWNLSKRTGSAVSAVTSKTSATASPSPAILRWSSRRWIPW